MRLPIRYRDGRLVVIDKPSGLLVHPSSEATDRETCLSLLRDQLGQFVYPVHRIDRGTSGLLIMALDRDTARKMHAAFAERTVAKSYIAVVRGYIEEGGRIEYPLKKKTDQREEAITEFIRLAQGELPFPVGRYDTARFSLVKAMPITGRRHQIRRHMAHIRHPIVGDTAHGDGKQNRLFRSIFGMWRLALHASALRFDHPWTGEIIALSSYPPDSLRVVIDRFGWKEYLEGQSRSN